MIGVISGSAIGVGASVVGCESVTRATSAGWNGGQRGREGYEPVAHDRRPGKVEGLGGTDLDKDHHEVEVVVGEGLQLEAEVS